MLARSVAAAALDKKASEILILDLRKLDAVTDFFVICTGDVDQQVRAIARGIEDRVRKTTGDRVLHREGMESLNWVLLDYVDVVVHVFKPSFREFYRLEDLWGDAAILAVHVEGDLTGTGSKRRKAALPKQPKVKAAPRTKAPATKKAKTAAPTSARSKAGGAASKPTPRKSAARPTTRVPAKPTKPAAKTPARKSPAQPKKPAKA